MFFRDKRYLKYLGGVLYAILMSIYVAIVLNIAFGLPIWLMFIQVLISMVILTILGIIVFELIKVRTDL